MATMRWLLIHAVCAATSHGLAEHGAGSCQASASKQAHCGETGAAPAAAGDHLLLQVGRQSLDVRAPGDFGEGTCAGMKDVKRTCSSSGCRVLAKTDGRSCGEYCAENKRACLAAWEEVSDDCDVKHPWSCEKPLEGTSDLLCECDARGGSPPSPGAGPSLPDPAGLSLVWSDEFEGGAVDASKWNIFRGGGGFGNQERQYYRGSNAVVRDGVLSITAKCEEYRGEHFTSSKLTTERLADWGPGHRVDVRARLPQGKGTWPAIWMLPTENSYGRWPASGEIDIMEAVGCTADKVYGTVHTGAYNHMIHTEKYSSLRTPVAEWHTYSIVWEAHQLRWYMDGDLFHTFAPSSFESEKWPFGQQFYLILNLAVGGSWGGSCVGGRPSCSSWDEFGREQVMEVDYARVYSLK